MDNENNLGIETKTPESPSYIAGEDGKFAPDWHTKAPEGLKVPDGIRTVPDFWTLVNMTINAQKKLGYPADALLVKPGKDWKDEQWNDFFGKIGRPNIPEDYKLNVSKGHDAELIKEFKILAHKSGLLPKQVEDIYAFYNGLAEKANEKTQEADVAAQQEVSNALKAEWSDKYNSNLQRAKKYVMTFADEADKQALMGRLGDDPALLRVLVNASAIMQEEKLLGVDEGSKNNIAGVENELNQIMTNPIYFDPQQSKQYPKEHDRLVQRAFRLRSILSAG